MMNDISRNLFVVYFNNPKVLRFLETVGHITYYSKKRKYAYLYIIDNNYEEVISKVKNHNAVRRVDQSFLFDSIFNNQKFINV